MEGVAEEEDMDRKEHDTNMNDNENNNTGNINEQVSHIGKEHSCSLNRKEDYEFDQKYGRTCTMLVKQCGYKMQ